MSPTLPPTPSPTPTPPRPLRRPPPVAGRAAAGAQRGHLDVQCNELNKWADRDGQDDDCNFEEGQWDVDLARLVVRVLTAKAAQRLQAQLQELDLHKAHWFNNYMSAHSPSGGNEVRCAAALRQRPAPVRPLPWHPPPLTPPFPTYVAPLAPLPPRP